MVKGVAEVLLAISQTWKEEMGGPWATIRCFLLIREKRRDEFGVERIRVTLCGAQDGSSNRRRIRFPCELGELTAEQLQKCARGKEPSTEEFYFFARNTTQ